MNYEDVIALARAGFNSAQIAQFAEEERAAAKAPAPAPVEKAPEETPKATAPAEVSVAPAAINVVSAPVSQTDDILKGITQELASLKQTIQSNNIKQSNQPPRESVESILASIISPTYSHKEE